MPDPLTPNAEQCFNRAIALAPDLLESYEALSAHYQLEQRPDEAEKAARKLLERFPDHIPTLTTLGENLHNKQDYPEALELFQKALKANPLDRHLRAQVSVAHVGCARLLIENNRCDEARPHLQSALTFHDDPEDSQIRCRWASLEFKAGNPDAAEEQLREARAHVGADFPVSFRMLTECVRIKLDKKLKARFDKEVKAGFAAPPTVPAVVGLLEFAASLKSGEITYYGQKTHEKKILTYAEKASRLDFTEQQYVDAITGLTGLDAWKQAQSFAERAERKYANNPEFLMLLARIYLRPTAGVRERFIRLNR